MALELAKAMLCQDRKGCGQCSHCVKIGKQMHPDVQMVEPDGADIKVDQIRDLVRNLHYRPFEAEKRVIIIDQADKMRDQSGNAFLKSLEEPPGYVHFLLVTSDWDQLLPTIRSRCQKLVFQSLGVDEKTRILESKLGLDSQLARRLAHISLRRLETEEEALAAFEDHVREGLSFFHKVVDDGHALDHFSLVLRNRSSVGSFLDHLLELSREILRTALGLESQEIFSKYGDQVAALAARVDWQHWHRMCLTLLALETKRKLNPNLGIWFNALSLNSLDQSEQSRKKLRHRLTRIGI